MKRIRAFVWFWYDFIIGDDWLVAAGVVAALVATYAVSRTSVPAWWIVPVAVVILLPLSLWRASRPRSD
ncbi:hypothetical protein M6D93_01410 [Jatrophihabitans telluris]|uniref:Uncharacterized protein n=1 Tax=Jatrophihabitans telluris TaxID=2038343 RepID=A0ABY4QZM9_9ACTN|nr:hypothetical protein [Jatrophihabitans telluris]UQX88672.1 hypothetical protein M6D93_01410 [Jatrophihabitans telluris]